MKLKPTPPKATESPRASEMRENEEQESEEIRPSTAPADEEFDALMEASLKASPGTWDALAK
jgi:hypothetical protein